MNGKKFKSGLRALCFAVVALPATAVLAIPVDTELSLLIDVSGSVSGTEFALQQQGYVDAFNNSNVVDAITDGSLGRIAVNVIYWSSAGSQNQVVGWTEVSDAASASALASAIGAAGRTSFGATAPGSAIAFADPLFDNNGFEGTRNVIDVSGDGIENSGLDTSNARDTFLAGAGAVNAINGIVIFGTSSTANANLLQFYENNVEGGVNSFTSVAADFASFGTAVDGKLIREIRNVPEPTVVALLAIGALGIGGAGLRRRKA